MSESIKIEVQLPQDDTYKESLRFYCQTCTADDPTLPFMASMWSFAIANEYLTGKQAKSALIYLNYRFKQYNLDEVCIHEDLSMEK